ncbi:MAG: HAD-IA family hydrolase [Gammaproteobacteria bacterium]|nr:HAD-IA family hydrolase [Gammaproteobacteria bacterium]
MSNPPHNFTTILFDLDGTLADTAPDLAFTLNTILEEQGLAALPLQTIRSHVSQGGAALIRLGFGENLDEIAFQRLRNRFLKLYATHICVNTRLFPEMDRVLTHIEDQGMKWGVVTNKQAWLTDPLMAALRLDQRASCIVSGDTTSERKPHPKPLLHACEVANSLPQHCLYLGDDPRDIQAGNAAGMTTLVARYGYIHADNSPEQWGADGIIDDIAELLDWLRSAPASGTGRPMPRHRAKQSPSEPRSGCAGFIKT